MRVLVGTLYSGENEFDECKKALDSQSFKDFEHIVISNHPNKQAHEKLYETFMQSEDFDKYLKLDADMVLQPGALEEMVSASEGHDVMMAYVKDCPSGLRIPGIQMFSNRCIWPESSDKLNVDTSPVFPGTLCKIRERDWVLHNPNPSDFQAFRYGIHRALKAIQPDRENKAVYKALLHFTILKNIWKQPKTKQRMLSIIGAEIVFSGCPIELVNDYSGDYAKALFKDVIKNYADFVMKINRSLWDEETFANDRFYVLLNAPIVRAQRKAA